MIVWIIKYAKTDVVVHILQIQILTVLHWFKDAHWKGSKTNYD